jgi:hypothetical protein
VTGEINIRTCKKGNRENEHSLSNKKKSVDCSAVKSTHCNGALHKKQPVAVLIAACDGGVHAMRVATAHDKNTCSPMDQLEFGFDRLQ